MKLKLIAALGLTCLALCAPRAHAAGYSQGDLLLGFHATGGTGADQTYVVNIGQGVLYRNGTMSLSLNIGADLASVFGANWFSRTDILFGAAGTPSNALTGNYMGDPTRTLYATRAENTPGVQSEPWVIPTSSARAQASTDMVTLQSAFLAAAANGATAPNSTIVPTSADNDWSDFNPPTQTQSFSAFNPTIEGIPTQVLDLYRVLNTNTGATMPGIVGTGQLLGTLRLDASGNVFFTAVPEPSTYALLVCGALAGVAVVARRRMAKAASL